MNQRPPPPSVSSSPSSSSPSSSPTSSIKTGEQDVGEFMTWKSSASGVKINYPSSWRVEKGKTPSSLVIFKSPQENPSDALLESVDIASYNIPTNKTLEQVMQEGIHDLEKKHHDFTLIEIVPTVLAGRQAHKMVYDADGRKRFMGVVMIEKNKVYQVMYVAEPSKYDSYLPIVQKMIDSFKIKQ